MSSSTPYRRIAINTVFQFGSKILSVLLSLASVGLLTRYLGQEKYGWFTLVFTYISFFTAIADVGYNQTIVREYSRKAQLSAKEGATFFNFKLILIGLSILLALIGLLFFPYDASVKTGIVIGTIAVAVSNLGSYGTSILQSQLRLDTVALLDIFVKAVTVGLIAWFVHLGLSFYAIISTILIGNTFGLVFEYLTVKNWIVFSWYLDKVLIQKILRLSIPVGITTFLSLLYFKVDTLMLSLMRSAEEVGIYGVSYKVLENILMLWMLIMASVFPLLSKYHGSASVSKYRDIFIKTLLLVAIMSAFIIVGGYMFAPLIMRILGGSKFFASMAPFKILLWSVPLLFLDNLFYFVIVSFGKTRYLILPLVISFVVNILLNFYAIPRYGYIGASYVTVITEVVTLITYIGILLTKFKSERQYLHVGI